MSGAASAGGWLLQAMIASALLMAMVLAVRGPARRMFGARVAYALWALPLLRLALPPLPASWHRAAMPVGRAGETLVLIVARARPLGGVAPAGLLPPLLQALCWCWAAGAAAFLLYHAIRHRRFCRLILARATPAGTVDGVRIVLSDAVQGPLAFGVWRPVVAFPADMADRYDAAERALALVHEIGHHQRGDLLANWAALAVLALHWPDPLAWIAYRAFRTDQEFANDARVLAGRSLADRHAYARALVKAASGGALSAACHLHTVADLKGRLKMLTISPASRRRLAVGGTSVGALLVAGLALTASGSSAAAIGAQVQQTVSVPAVAPPAPAVAAVAPAAPVPPVKAVAARGGGIAAVRPIVAPAQPAVSPFDGSGRQMILGINDDPDTQVVVQNIPAVSTANCGAASGPETAMVIVTGKDKRRKIVICADRIRAASADAMTVVGNTKDLERNAYAQALAGLLDARTKAVADVGMSAAARARALGAIDTSIAEMRSQLARFD